MLKRGFTASRRGCSGQFGEDLQKPTGTRDGRKDEEARIVLTIAWLTFHSGQDAGNSFRQGTR